MFKRLPHLSFIVAIVIASLAAAPAMATDEVPAPPAPPAQSGQPSTGGPGACTDRSKPTSRISTSSSRAARTGVVRGTASDRGCGASGSGVVSRVTVSVQRNLGKRCQFMSSKGRLGSAKSCARPTWLSVHGTRQWSFGLPKRLPRGAYVVRVLAHDSAGNVGSQRSLRVRMR